MVRKVLQLLLKAEQLLIHFIFYSVYCSQIPWNKIFISRSHRVSWRVLLRTSLPSKDLFFLC